MKHLRRRTEIRISNPGVVERDLDKGDQRIVNEKKVFDTNNLLKSDVRLNLKILFHRIFCKVDRSQKMRL